MSDKKREINEKMFREEEFYREKIIDMVNQIENVWILKTIHNFIVGMTKEGN